MFAVALLAFLGTGKTSAQVSGPSGSQTFGYEDGAIAPFLVPGGVYYIYIDARGGHGGSTEHTAQGGRAGQVSGVIPVTPGELLGVQVGGWGNAKGGLGCGKGGDHGTAPGDSSGDSGAGGGGGTCVYRQVGDGLDDWQPLIVAGGGGGGGGNDSYADASVGGAGGDGGLHPQPGSPGHDQDGRPNIEGRKGGCGGCRQSQDGGGGENASVFTLHGGGGGGGGGGFNGGAGGDNGVYEALQTDPIGGSGGGGGSSWTDPTVLDVHHSVSSTPCEYSDPPDPNCHGQVTLSWGKPAATATASAGNGAHAFVGQQFPALAVTVRDANGIPVSGVFVEFKVTGSPSGPSGSFSWGSTTANALTDSQGVASVSGLVANAIAGSWTLEATVDGIAKPVRFNLTNDAAPTTVTITSTANPSVVGEEVGFVATVSAAPAFHSIPPTGPVEVTIDGAPVGPPIQIDSQTGKAVVPASQVPSLAPGPHAVVARYLGDQAHLGSQGAIAQEVEQAATTVTLTSDPNPSQEGEGVAFEAVVKPQAAGGPVPTGTVSFEDGGGNPLGSEPLDGEGKAEWETDSLSATTKVVARYGGDANYEASSGSVTQSVGPAATATIVESSSNPAVHGEEITWTATVRRQTPGTPPEGTIGFEVDGSEACQPAPVDGEGKVTCAPDAPLAVGEHSVVATFEPEQGSGDEASEGSLEQRVVAVRTSLDLSVDPEPSTLGAPITLSAAVSALGSSAAKPAGEVQFALDGGAVGAPVALSGDGVAALETSCEPPPVACNPPVGAHAVEAEFVPSGSDVRGAKASAVHWVRPASTTTSLQSSANPQRQGERVRFTATVSSASGLRPFGTVQFLADGAPFSGPVALQGGTAISPPLETLPPGTHEIEALFLGSGSFSPSSASLSQQITRVLPPRLRAAGRRLRVRPNGTFPLRLRCGGTDEQRCRAHVHVVSAQRARLSTGRRAPKGFRLAIRSIEMPTTKKRRVTFSLTRDGVRLLSGRRSLAARVRIDPHLGTLAGRAKRVRLVLPKRGLRISDGRRPGGTR